jgi:WD repeat-containing protein 68
MLQIQVLDTRPGPADPSQPGAPTLEFTKLAEATHTYPITRVLWEPPSSKPLTDLLATSGDHLRLWSLPTSSSTAAGSNSNSITSRNYQATTQKLTPLALLSNSKSTDFTAPLTSLDWNQVSPSLIITSSIDTTCTIWDIPTLTAKTQLIAHDKEVFDVRFMSNSVDVFASCGADGSVRMFDLRSLEHSTIIYEPGSGKASSSSSATDRDGGSPVNNGTPPALLRLAASPHDQHLIATFCVDSPVVRILDVRQPGQALVELKGHAANINCCEWNPGRRGVLAAGGDDCEILVWDVFGAGGAGPSGSIKTEKGVEQERNPIAWWGCETEVNNLSWSPSVGKTGSDWIGVVGGRGVYGLAV